MSNVNTSKFIKSFPKLESAREYPALSDVRIIEDDELKESSTELVKYDSLKTDYSDEFWKSRDGGMIRIGDMNFAHLVNTRNFVAAKHLQDKNGKMYGVYTLFWMRIFNMEIRRRLEVVCKEKHLWTLTGLPYYWDVVPNFAHSSKDVFSIQSYATALTSASTDDLITIIEDVSDTIKENLHKYCFISGKKREDILILCKLLLTLRQDRRPTSEQKKILDVDPESHQLSLF